MWTVKRRSTRSVCRVKAKGVPARDRFCLRATDRQERIPGFHQDKLREAKVGLVGAGGINSEVGRALARKGIGALDIFDDDVVTLSNYSRQAFFPRDLYKKKALRLPHNLALECVYPTVITGHALRFEDALDQGLAMDCDIYVFGVDNDQARVEGSRVFLNKVPILVMGTGPEANNGYVFVQEPGQACFLCMFPQALERKTRQECVPSSIDILKAIAGIATYAIDSLFMGRPRHWNYREMFLDGRINDRTIRLDPWPKCPVCSDTARNEGSSGGSYDKYPLSFLNEGLQLQSERFQRIVGPERYMDPKRPTLLLPPTLPV